MGMKKSYKKIAVASAFALAAGFATTAQATVNMKANTGSALFANEIAVASTGTFLATVNTSPLDAAAPVGFSIGHGQSKYIRFDFAGARVGTDLAPANFTYADLADSGEATTCTFVVAQGGKADDTYVIVEVIAGGGDDGVAQDDTVTFVADGKIEVTAKESATVTYGIYEGAAEAINKTGLLKGYSAKYFAWMDALVVKGAETTPNNVIDVTNESKQFVNDLSGSKLLTRLSDVDIVVATTPSTPLDTDGNVIGLNDLLSATPANNVLTISGDFTATQDLDPDGVPDGTYTQANVFLDNDGGCGDVDQFAATLTDTTATFAIDNSGANVANASELCMVVNGKSIIAAGNYSGVFAPTAASAAVVVSSKDMGVIGSLAKNGSSNIRNFALTPGGVFNNFVRVSNMSNMAGKVYFRLYQDDGTVSSTFTLSDIDASFSDTLAGQASTAQMTIQQLYDASGLAAGYSGKLRIEAEGEFDVPNGWGGALSIQTYTMSLDGNNFSTF